MERTQSDGLVGCGPELVPAVDGNLLNLVDCMLLIAFLFFLQLVKRFERGLHFIMNIIYLVLLPDV